MAILQELACSWDLTDSALGSYNLAFLRAAASLGASVGDCPVTGTLELALMRGVG